MPAARTQKSMRQTTLSFGKPKPRPKATSDDSASSSSPVSSSSSSSSPSPSDDSQIQTYVVALDFDSSSHSSSASLSPPPPKAKAKPRPATKPAFDADGRSTTDVLLTIKPEFTKLIAQRKKNHEYRKYKLKESVCRLWLYETAPTSAITYVMTTARPKVPGEVRDSSGIGNDDFDAGLKQSKYGYPVTELYKLKKPLTTTELKARFDMPVPQGWRYATRSLVEGVPLEDMERLF